VATGSGVETGEDFFLEGVFDGEDFTRSGLLMGSGGKLEDGGVVFASPCHALEPLHLVRRGDHLLVSNSLPYVLEAADLHLDDRYPHYRRDLWSRMRGFDRAEPHIRTREDVPVELCYYTNLRVDAPNAQLRVTRLPKPAPPDWADFAEYRAYLASGTAALIRCAAARGMEPIATLSTGYDSPTVAILAQEAGCQKTISFERGKEFRTTGAWVADSGARIGRHLGLDVREVPNRDDDEYGAAAAEFAACGDAFDLQFALLEKHIEGTCLLTGFRGGRVWDRVTAVSGPHLGALDPSGTSLCEFRLRVGFAHVPVPIFGAANLDRLHEISNSGEMRPWVVGGDYDRPIPRRIIEERGVPRGWFARSKRGSVAVVQRGRRPTRTVAGFEAHYRDRRDTGLRAVCGFLRYRATRIGYKLGLIGEWDVSMSGHAAHLVQWGVEEVRERYRAAGP